MNSITKATFKQSPIATNTIPTVAPRRVASQALLGEAKALLILHNGREYQLRLTQNGKLILTA
jgi:hemin uptake protein HemP